MATAGDTYGSGYDAGRVTVSDRILVVTVEFNPVKIVIIGNIKPSTRDKLCEYIPVVTTSSSTPKNRLQFVQSRPDDNKPHWVGTLPGSYCSYDAGMCLEMDGGWRLRASNSVSHDTTKVTYQFVFSRRIA